MSVNVIQALVQKPCQNDVPVNLDIPRTISGHLHLHTRYRLGQRSLFNVLHAFEQLFPECGNCQGMGSLAATVLCYLPPEMRFSFHKRPLSLYETKSLCSYAASIYRNAASSRHLRSS